MSSFSNIIQGKIGEIDDDLKTFKIGRKNMCQKK